MSMEYCEKCECMIDTDYNAEHFDGGCLMDELTAEEELELEAQTVDKELE